MTRPLRSLLVAALLAPALALAQTDTNTTVTPVVPASVQVGQLAPQLVAFAGGQVNFDSLVNGLALGQSVTLSSVLTNGLTQVVSFTPAGTLTTTQIAQTLESARQSLISRGIAAPTSQQLAVVLAGGTLPTQTGAVAVSALLPANVVPAPAAAGGTRDAAAPTTATGITTTLVQPNGTPSPSALLQGQSGAGGTTPPSPAAILQQQRGGNISDTPTLGNTSNNPTTGAATTPSVASQGPAATTGPEPRATQQQAAPLPGRERSAPASPSSIGR